MAKSDTTTAQEAAAWTFRRVPVGLGHKDGSALAIKTYGHLRREHSIAQAQRVTFTLAPHEQADVITFRVAG